MLHTSKALNSVRFVYSFIHSFSQSISQSENLHSASSRDLLGSLMWCHSCLDLHVRRSSFHPQNHSSQASDLSNLSDFDLASPVSCEFLLRYSLTLSYRRHRYSTSTQSVVRKEKSWAGLRRVDVLKTEDYSSPVSIELLRLLIVHHANH